ncbi:hypothetical protein LOAG_13245 [Loa loa]|uniref:Uncharacterized protein n=2 Tax=Loa loa TaxID=7209 RepID=A0A1S0TJR1_LOALO|nr:hypothetical protein LOAG_13245 [Loa loa]EFO15269.2 hypothetical protein LOAG_13245 [Loa loa]
MSRYLHVRNAPLLFPPPSLHLNPSTMQISSTRNATPHGVRIDVDSRGMKTSVYPHGGKQVYRLIRGVGAVVFATLMIGEHLPVVKFLEAIELESKAKSIVEVVHYTAEAISIIINKVCIHRHIILVEKTKMRFLRGLEH